MKCRKSLIVLLLLVPVVFVFACAGTTNFTPKQKYYLTRMTFNDIVEQYTTQAKQQPEEIRIMLRKNVNPVIKEARDALDLYKASIGTGSEGLNRDFYLKAVDKLTDLLLKYGIKIKEE